MSESKANLSLGLIETELAIIVLLLALSLLQGGEEEPEHGKDNGKDGKKENKENKGSIW